MKRVDGCMRSMQYDGSLQCLTPIYGGVQFLYVGCPYWKNILLALCHWYCIGEGVTTVFHNARFM